MYAYRRREREEGRHLRFEEYEPAILTWAAEYLHRDPASVISAGDSLVREIIQRIGAKISECARQRQEKERKSTTCQKRKRQVQISSSEDFELESIQGKPVIVKAYGAVKLARRPPHNPLEMVLTNQMAKRIVALKDTPIVHFSSSELQLHVKGSVVYRNPIERLLASVNGNAWFPQVCYELEVLSSTSDQRETRVQEVNDAVVIPQYCTSSRNSPWNVGQLRTKLLKGAEFNCKKSRITIRDVEIRVPPHVNVDTVFLRAELIAKGMVHPNVCGWSAQGEDPACRLGIKMRHKLGQDDETNEIWVTLQGEQNVKKLNSLVDFLEDRDEAWTEKQPRRYLKDRGGKRAYYTS